MLITVERRRISNLPLPNPPLDPPEAISKLLRKAEDEWLWHRIHQGAAEDPGRGDGWEPRGTSRSRG